MSTILISGPLHRAATSVARLVAAGLARAAERIAAPAALLASFLLASPMAVRAACPSTAPVAQAQTVRTAIGPVTIRAIEPAGPALTRLEFLTTACRTLLAADFGAGEPEAQGPEAPPHLLRFRALQPDGFPDPIVLATLANPGASDVFFETRLFAVVAGRLRPLLPRPISTLLEGGVFLGDLGAGLGPGLAVWTLVWGKEPHVDPHRYALHRWRWTGTRFAPLAAMTTRHSYGTPAAALREFGVGYHDMAQDFPEFSPYR